MINRFYDLTFIQQADNSIRLTQSEHGEDYVIDVHPQQVLFVARQLCGMKPETADKVADLERRIAVLTDKVQDFVCDQHMRSDLIKQCGDGFFYLAKLDALLDLALEFDGGRLTPMELPPDTQERPLVHSLEIAKPLQPTFADAQRSECAQLGLPV